jgi:hypothetical protein
VGRIQWEDLSPGQAGEKVRSCLQNNQSKKAGGMAQAVEHLPSKHKTLNSNPNTAKEKKEKKEERKDGRKE